MASKRNNYRYYGSLTPIIVSYNAKRHEIAPHKTPGKRGACHTFPLPQIAKERIGRLLTLYTLAKEPLPRDSNTRKSLKPVIVREIYLQK